FQLSFILVNAFYIPVTVKQGREKLRELFMKNKHVTDIRAIDMLVIKGQMDLVETANIWKQRNHVMMFFKDTVNPKPTDFLSKFYEGND
uniref:NADH dehydrogenase [ubiquinone] 1 alpha subcomplex subunit 6 n=1 Tax=Biomphalaria glabrata TaxID=6526 RepID=A0A2C9JZP1_BIOGL